MSQEHVIQNQIRNALAEHCEILFRVWCGEGRLMNGGYAKGANPGTSDLCGLKSITITPEMVGKKIGVFVAIEVKDPNGRTKKERAVLQENFRQAVRNAGGVAGVARSADEAVAIVTEKNNGQL